MQHIMMTDQQYDALMEMREQLQTQDNLATANPLFCVYQKEKVLKADGRGDLYGWLDKDAGHIHTDVDGKPDPELLEKLTDESPGSSTPEDAESILEDNIDYERVEFSIEDVPVAGQCYLTRKEAQRHIDLNHYHYHQPFVFVDSAWRNPEIELLRQIILGNTKESEVRTQ